MKLFIIVCYYIVISSISSFGIIIIFIFIFYRIIKIALKENNLFKKYLAFGLGFGIIIQSLLNITVVIGLIPVTGVTFRGTHLLHTLFSPYNKGKNKIA